jgi:hypothetical protein
MDSNTQFKLIITKIVDDINTITKILNDIETIGVCETSVIDKTEEVDTAELE